MKHGLMKEVVKKLSDYTPEESKRIYKILKDEWELRSKYGKLQDISYLGGFQ